MKMIGFHRTMVRTLALAGVSLAVLSLAVEQASAQEANTPRRGVSANAGSVQLDELSVESRGAGERYGPVSSGQPGPGRPENPNGPIDGFVAKRSVTALKTNTPLIETPQSITVVGRQQLDAQNAQNLSQATQYVAGTYASPFGYDTRLDYFLLRGFVASDYGLYLNGLQTLNYGFGYFRYDTFGLERVEVLRGPAAVLFGAGPIGGIINQVSKRPTEDPFGYVEVGGGSYGQKYAAFDVGGPVDKEGHYFYRLTGYGRNGGTQIDGLQDNSYFIAPAFTYKPDGATTFTVLTAFQHDTTGVSANFLPYAGTVRPQALGLRILRSTNVGDRDFNTFQRDQAFLGYQFEHVFNDTWSFRQNLRYSFGDSYQNSYIGNGYAFGDATQTQLARYQFLVKDRVNIFQVDNQAEARFFDGFFRHDLLMGVDYKDYRLSDNQGTNFGANPFYSAPDLNILAPAYGGPAGTPGPYQVNFDTFKQLGLYGQDQIKLTDQLTLLVGVRQDFAENRINDKLTNGARNDGRNDTATTYRTALIYNFDFGLAPYVSYSTSFQPLIGTDINNRTFRPETGDQIEGGVKFEPPGQGYFVTLAGFDIRRQNVLTANPTNPQFQSQLGEVRSTGFEAQLTATVFSGLNVSASYTIYGLTNEKNGDPTLIGKVPVNTPENFANVFFDYTFPTGELRGFGFGGGARYIGRSFADQANLFHVPEYVLFDAQVHYNWDRWRFQVNATNLADRRFVSSCQTVNACFYGQARQVLASISYKW
ncbi:MULTISPECIES: TonB-dependent siderophore receptor [unclassified Methylobacterium]|uniref:TonB-dependent siderophore receptor n=1 Tax=unclassified Methylobacterium TaxID=2615210 RepID=UPI0011C20A2C|nr:MULTISPECIES: TonB-dependent siderophore receptor [unclassified Methylobacterium]QEE38786.1 TonB-dependent siderophore receptor [Methylobacterium sp. WL1]TXN57410.1 TonB-dependent siderophore receptor [Methylobacterium sp. WL2]